MPNIRLLWYQDFNELQCSFATHFHAEYQNYEAIIEIVTGGVSGKIPRRALNLIWAWQDLHRAELFENWKRARRRQPLKPIDPLP